MNQIEIILNSTLPAFIFVHVLNIPNKLKQLVWKTPEKFKRIKPFDCVGCLSFWASLAITHDPKHIYLLCLAYLLGRQLDKNQRYL